MMGHKSPASLMYVYVQSVEQNGADIDSEWHVCVKVKQVVFTATGKIIWV